MQKRYVVRLTNQERDELRSVIKKLKGTAQKVRRAHILLSGRQWAELDRRTNRGGLFVSNPNGRKNPTAAGGARF